MNEAKTVAQLAAEMAAPSYTGGTYAVYIAPFRVEGVVFHDYVFPANGRFAVGGGAPDGARVFPANLAKRPLAGNT